MVVKGVVALRLRLLLFVAVEEEPLRLPLRPPLRPPLRAAPNDGDLALLLRVRVGVRVRVRVRIRVWVRVRVRVRVGGPPLPRATWLRARR